MTILLAGATGFLGSHLFKSFIVQGHTVIVLKRSGSDCWRINALLDETNVASYDIDRTPLEDVFKRHMIDAVINTVTNYGRKDNRISRIVDTNVMFALQLLEAAQDAGVKYFLNTDTLLPAEVNPYALSKHQFVEWMRMLAGEMKMINVKIEHMYGPLDDNNKFVSWFISQLKAGTDSVALTSGIQKRDFIYVDDIVDAYNTILVNLEGLSSFETFELGSGDAVEVRSFCEGIYDALAKKNPLKTRLDFGKVPYREKEQMVMQADISKLIELGWTPKVTMSQGIQKLIEEE